MSEETTAPTEQHEAPTTGGAPATTEPTTGDAAPSSVPPIADADLSEYAGETIEEKRATKSKVDAMALLVAGGMGEEQAHARIYGEGDLGSMVHRLHRLIDNAGLHLTRLDPPLRWEGALDAAVEAAADEIERLRGMLKSDAQVNRARRRADGSGK